MLTSELLPIWEKVERGKRLGFADGLTLLTTPDLLGLGFMADRVRRRLHGDRAYFIVNAHLNHTNVCALNCKFCAFAVKPGHPRAYTLSLEEIAEKLRPLQGRGIREVHITGGINPKLSFSYYTDMLRLVKEILPDVHVQAFTAVEIDYMSRLFRMDVSEVLARLREAGLGSLLGGGAEVFDPEVRLAIAGHKTDAERWLEIHRIAHGMGIRSNASILYGTIERPEHVVDHLLRLRELQDETGGFDAFFGFAFHPENTPLARERAFPRETSGMYDLRILATARLLLDNFAHIRVLWMMTGLKLAQVALYFGADDIDGTVIEEHIIHDAGSEAPQGLTKEELIALLREAGRIPVERDTLYRPVAVYA
ncbi:aminofutalosine synthase MqnE [Brockia lithotrophica]|uniref:Aminodeoxyfutalosine synthase n=1 Tax=Brockia lithotrophica TaxID=933949 RepID=A0A660L0B8_9BACL|nr:aminofutalosine synthase MqnE [Brockia lithotrophica]RKQ84690.1 de-hypoxanthine futalosine cyclase [Brockia lithotrophica]